MNLDSNTTKWLGYGLIAGGVCLGGYAVYNHMSKPKKGTAGLGGVKRRKKSKKKSSRK